MSKIEVIMADKGTPSLKAIAGVFDLNPVRLYSVAKQPKEGVVYDAKVFNWDAIERFIARRLDADKGLATLEDVIDKALELDEELKKTDGRRRNSGGVNAQIEVDGKMISKRRFANFEMESNTPIALRDDVEIYGIVLQTASHTVVRPLNSADVTDYKGNEVKVISNGMLNMRGVGPSSIEDAIQERLSGQYAEYLAKKAANKAEEAAKVAEAAKDTATEPKKKK